MLVLLAGLAGTPPAGVDSPPRCVANVTHGCTAADAPWPADRTFAANDTAAPPGRGWPRPDAPAAGPSGHTASGEFARPHPLLFSGGPRRARPRPRASGTPCRRRGPNPMSPSAEDGGAAMVHPGARYMRAVPGPHLTARLTAGFTTALVRSPHSLRYSTAQPHMRATSPLALPERARASRGRTRPHCTRLVTPPPAGC